MNRASEKCGSLAVTQSRIIAIVLQLIFIDQTTHIIMQQ